MKVILLERVGRLGTIGDEVNVKDGFGRNFLLPLGKALRANAANRARFEAERAVIEKRNEERRDAAAGIAEGLNGTSVVMIRQAGENGQLYGSVSSRDISEGLAAQNFAVTRNQVELALPIKTVGIHKIALSLHADVEVFVDVNVARSQDEAERQSAGEDMTVFSFDDEQDDDIEDVAEGDEEAAEDGEASEEAASDADASEDQDADAKE